VVLFLMHFVAVKPKNVNQFNGDSLINL